MIDPVIGDMMDEIGWNDETRIDVLLDFINDELGAIKDLKRYIEARADHEKKLTEELDDGTT